MIKPSHFITAIAGIFTLNFVTLLPVIAAPIPVKASLEMAQMPSQISLALLKNATYTIPEQGTYQLTEGQYEADDLTVTLLSEPIAVGNGDAAVILGVNTGGSGVFMYLAAVVIEDGQVSNPDTISLGDRVRIQSLKIKDGRIRLNMLTHQADDPQCCPSQLVSMAYQLDDQAGTLKPIELSDQEKQQIHVEDLPSQMLPGDDNVPFQPQDNQFQIKF